MAKEKEGAKKAQERQPSAKKRDLQSEKNRLRNRAFKSRVRTAVRDLEEALPKGDAANVQTCLNEVYSLMDKGVKTGVFKANKASRTKARMAARAAAKA
jgi:small subunit ribosomal protein S20